MFKNVNSGLIASRGSFLTNRNRLLFTRLITNSSGVQFYDLASGYQYHIFTSPGEFDIHTWGKADVFLVGGGGGGGGTGHTPSPYYSVGSGGGGAGGVNTKYNVPLPVAPYKVFVGNGGAAGQDGADMLNPANGVQGRGERGGVTAIQHGYWYEPPSISNNFTYRDDTGSVIPTTSFFIYNFTRLQEMPSAIPSDFKDEFSTRDPFQVSSSFGGGKYSAALIANGGGGGGATMNTTPFPTSQPYYMGPDGYIGGEGGSQGGGGIYTQYQTALPTHVQPALERSWPINTPIDGSQGNAGGSGQGTADTSNAGQNAGGGGGGAGGSGQNGGSTLDDGIGGPGVGAFGGDTAIPNSYGYAVSGSPYRYFAKGGNGGDRGPVYNSAAQKATYVAGDANTGNGGHGGRHLSGDGQRWAAQEGGSGIVIIRYQAAL